MSVDVGDALCRGCGGRLDAILVEPDGDGIHPMCRAEPAPILPTLAGILDRHQNGIGTRSQQRHIGPSEVGDPCDRALGYRLQRVPRARDEGLKWAPLIGTWAHTGIAEALTQENERLKRPRYLIEERVEIAPPLLPGGQVDCYDTDTEEVIDWKLTGKTRMTHYRRHGPGDVYRTQAHLYAYGWRKAGKDPKSVRIVFLPKWSVDLLDGYEWSEPYRPEIAENALRRLQRVTYLTTAVAVAADARNWALIPSAPGSDNCTYCPWRRPGGPADATGCPGDSDEVLAKATASMGRGLVA